MKAFIRKETVFCISLLAAVISAFFNPPSAAYLQAPDYRTLALLFCLMGISEGLKSAGIFTYAAGLLERKASTCFSLSLMLTALVFFISMFFTNDVALLMLVPFTMMIAAREKFDENYLIRLIVIETVAANLGSMATPVGNPQNIFICSHFSLSAPDFFSIILPYCIISAVLIAVCSFLFLKSGKDLEKAKEERTQPERRQSMIYLAFLALALLAVFNVLDWRILLAIMLVFLVLFDRKTLFSVDYILLLTFVCFFIFSANIKSIDAVSALLTEGMKAHPLALSVLVSQVISNVPAAILLSPFSSSAAPVLIGTDIGGLGTPVASLASLISLKLYFRKEDSVKGRYLAFFLAVNLVLLILLCLSALFLSQETQCA